MLDVESTARGVVLAEVKAENLNQTLLSPYVIIEGD